jgi:hypothetical protein
MCRSAIGHTLTLQSVNVTAVLRWSSALTAKDFVTATAVSVSMQQVRVSVHVQSGRKIINFKIKSHDKNLLQ